LNDRTRLAALSFSIAAVERDTGLSKDTLRVWERRYLFPTPQRDVLGERVYSMDQVDKLRIVKRLMDAGHRPGRIVPLSMQDLQALSDQMVDAPQPALGLNPRSGPGADAVDLREHLDLIRSHRMGDLRAALTRQVSRLGVVRFVGEVVAPLNAAVGDAWIRGQMEIFEEHAYTEAVQIVLRQTIGAMPEPTRADAPRVLLTTFPGEQHSLGLLMAEAVLTLEGCRCVSLGVQTPLWDIVLAAAAFRSDVVALSFTGSMNPNQVVDSLTELRSKLPLGVQLWAGGSAPVLHRRPVPGVTALASMDDVPRQLKTLNPLGA
jgi:MerR family transcriptional regulator, light-induced transcriptional regulator